MEPAMTPTAVRRTIWAGWWMVGIAALHLVYWSIATWADWGAWAAGGLWGAEPVTARDYRLHHGYWALVASFMVPLFLLGLLIIRLARLGIALPRYVGRVMLGWVLVASALMEPNGFPLGFIPAILLLRAQSRRQSSGT